jgi:hypothetical protein
MKGMPLSSHYSWSTMLNWKDAKVIPTGGGHAFVKPLSLDIGRNFGLLLIK